MNAPEKQSAFRIVGTRPVRPDGAEKVTGKAVYGPDFRVAGMIYGAVVRSPHAHARIRGIDSRKAEALPGVKAVVTGHDFPTLESLAMAIGESQGDILNVARNCMALEKALYEGHAVAAVAATSQAIADEAALRGPAARHRYRGRDQAGCAHPARFHPVRGQALQHRRHDGEQAG